MGIETIYTDVLVIGAGLAGLRAIGGNTADQPGSHTYFTETGD